MRRVDSSFERKAIFGLSDVNASVFQGAAGRRALGGAVLERLLLPLHGYALYSKGLAVNRTE